jgi:hypothetical protein
MNIRDIKIQFRTSVNMDLKFQCHKRRENLSRKTDLDV